MAAKTSGVVDVNALIERALKRAGDRKIAAERLAVAVAAAAEPIARTALAAEVRASVALPSDLDNEGDDRSRSYRLTARDGAILVERRDDYAAECDPRTPWTIWRAVWVDEPADSWDGWTQAVRLVSGGIVRCESCQRTAAPGGCTHCERQPQVWAYRSVPRHVLIAIAPKLSELAAAVAAKADKQASETESALAAVMPAA